MVFLGGIGGGAGATLGAAAAGLGAVPLEGSKKNIYYLTKYGLLGYK